MASGHQPGGKTFAANGFVMSIRRSIVLPRCALPTRVSVNPGIVRRGRGPWPRVARRRRSSFQAI